MTLTSDFYQRLFFNNLEEVDNSKVGRDLFAIDKTGFDCITDCIACPMESAQAIEFYASNGHRLFEVIGSSD